MHANIGKLNDFTRNLSFDCFSACWASKYGSHSIWESKTKLLNTCQFSVLRRKTLKRMQTNQYEEIGKHYKKGIFCVFLSLLHTKKTRKCMPSTLYWETKGHYEPYVSETKRHNEKRVS